MSASLYRGPGSNRPRYLGDIVDTIQQRGKFVAGRGRAQLDLVGDAARYPRLRVETSLGRYTYPVDPDAEFACLPIYVIQDAASGGEVQQVCPGEVRLDRDALRCPAVREPDRTTVI